MDFANLVYLHKRRIAFSIGFGASYGLLCTKATNYKNDTLRLAVAGSLANCVCESAFHIVDTVNVKAKVEST
jgi:hypothetical protein